jgi:DNA-binding response OmpR family regulator/DNA-binding CsgD family transcriptional regulator
MNPFKILIIDDDPLILELLARTLRLQENGYSFYKAVNGKEGVDAALEILPDLIIMDWEMPEMDGIEATKALKANKNTAAIPIIISTGIMNSSENLKIALEAGAVDFIRKPFDGYELQARVKSSLLLAQSWKTILEQKEQLLQKEKESLQKELDFKNKELINFSIFITKNYRKDQRILEQIKRLYPYLNKTGNKLLEKIVKDNSFDIEQAFWSDFELLFDDIYPAFFKSLQKMHPNLTPNEKKLCAYIRLNMSTKDIAEITHLDPKSINIARSRLRAKLKLDRESNLFIYLSLIF